MKKIKWIAILFAIVVSMVLAGCSNPTSGGGSSEKKEEIAMYPIE